MNLSNINIPTPPKSPPTPKVKQAPPTDSTSSDVSSDETITIYNLDGTMSLMSHSTSTFDLQVEDSSRDRLLAIAAKLRLNQTIAKLVHSKSNKSKIGKGSDASLHPETYESRKVSKVQTKGQMDSIKQKGLIQTCLRQPQFPKMTRQQLRSFLKTWDDGSGTVRVGLVVKFFEDYNSIDPLDLDFYLAKGGSLILIRFLIGMQISFQCKKPVAHYFLALGIFIHSLTGERYTYEFGIGGGFETTFEILRVAAMSNHDKFHAFYFLYSILEGKGGPSAKRYLCSDTSFLECVVDCLTMCQNEDVIQEAQQFLQNLCIGNRPKNLVMISKYIISLLPCDFNPRVQAMACSILRGIINQNPDVAGSCHNLIVDVLKSNFVDGLVDVGNVCIAIMGTPTADDLVSNLIQAAQPYNLLDDLHLPGVTVLGGPRRTLSKTTSEERTSSSSEEDEEEEIVESETETETLEGGESPMEHDPYFRLQYGSIYILSYMLKNRPDFADWMIERGIIGSLLTGIGTTCYTSVQLEATRLLLLLHELSDNTSVALASLLPKKLLATLYMEHEDLLKYLTSSTCMLLRRLGSLVEDNWSIWFPHVVRSPKILQFEATADQEQEGELTDSEETLFAMFHEVETLVELLDKSLSDPFLPIVELMKIMLPDPDKKFSGHRLTRATSISIRKSSRIVREKLKPGEEYIQDTESLEPFRKYLRKDHFQRERRDEFDKYYASKFSIVASDSTDLDTLQMSILHEAEVALRSIKDPFQTAPSVAEDIGKDEDPAKSLFLSMFPSEEKDDSQDNDGASTPK